MVEIIAEIGVNHNGSVDMALDLIDAAIMACCDTVKFQLWDTRRVYPRERWDEMERLELSRDSIALLKDYCGAHGIRFLCTPDDIDDARFLRDIGVDRIKVGSSNITNLPLLHDVAAFGLPMIVSTGACDMNDVARAINALRGTSKGARDFTLLHCVSAYPAPLDEMNMRAIQMLAGFGYPVGFSDHTCGSHAAVMAMALGVSIIEKHLTWDPCQRGPDHAASLDPIGMKDFVSVMRKCETILGDGCKRVMPCEEKHRADYIDFVERQLERIPC